MELRISQYIYQLLKKAHYEYDPSVESWTAWIKDFHGVYAQGKTVEDVRLELISVLEEFLLMDLEKGKRIPHFSTAPKRQYAKTN